MGSKNVKSSPSIYTQRKQFPAEPAYKIKVSGPVDKDVSREVAFICVLINRHRHNMSRGDYNIFELELTNFLRKTKAASYGEGLRDMDMCHAKVDQLLKNENDG